MFLLSFPCISECSGSQSFADMFYEQKLYVRDDDVTSHVTILNFFVSLVSCLFRKLRVPSYSNMSHETQGCELLDDVTSHVTILNFFISLVSCLFRKLKSAKLLQHVICDLGVRVAWWRHKSSDYIKLLFFACILLISKAVNAKLFQYDI